MAQSHPGPRYSRNSWKFQIAQQRNSNPNKKPTLWVWIFNSQNLIITPLGKTPRFSSKTSFTKHSPSLVSPIPQGNHLATQSGAAMRRIQTRIPWRTRAISSPHLSSRSHPSTPKLQSKRALRASCCGGSPGNSLPPRARFPSSARSKHIRIESKIGEGAATPDSAGFSLPRNSRARGLRFYCGRVPAHCLTGDLREVGEINLLEGAVFRAYLEQKKKSWRLGTWLSRRGWVCCIIGVWKWWGLVDSLMAFDVGEIYWSIINLSLMIVSLLCGNEW